MGCSGAATFEAPPSAPPSAPQQASSGRFVYVANQGSSDISGFSLDTNSGTLAAIPGSPVSTASPPVALAVALPGDEASEDSRVYLIVATQAAQILVFRIDEGGVLIAVTGSTGHGQPAAIAVDHNRVYVANAVTNNVSAFSMSPSGALTPVSGSPFPTGLAEVRSLALHGNAARLVVVGSPGLAEFVLDASGHLGAPTLVTENVPADIEWVAASDASGVVGAGGLVFLLSSTGLHAYGEGQGFEPVCVDVPFHCRITVDPLPVGSQPSFVTASGSDVFVSNSGSHDLTAFTFHGGLPVSFSPLLNTLTGLGPSSVEVVEPDSSAALVLVTNQFSNNLSVFRYTEGNGLAPNSLTEVSGSPVATGMGPVRVAR